MTESWKSHVLCRVCASRPRQPLPDHSSVAISPTTLDEGVTFTMGWAAEHLGFTSADTCATSAIDVSSPIDRACALRWVNCPPGSSWR